LVKRDATHLVVEQSERLLQMPRDGLSLSIGVGREIDQLRPRRGFFQIADSILLRGNDLIRRLVAVRAVEPELSLGKVAYMAHARLHRVARSQEFVDGLRLLRAFHDDECGPSALAGRLAVDRSRLAACRPRSPGRLRSRLLSSRGSGCRSRLA